jgi:methyl-accepting chemotaxis protein
MMTPEEVQRTMDFILASHANSAVRMERLEERLEENQVRHEQNMARLEQRLEENQVRHERNMARLEQNLDKLGSNVSRLEDQQKDQKETLGIMIKMTQDLLKGLQMVADRTKRLETRSDSVDEMIKVIRDLLENNLRRPDNP